MPQQNSELASSFATKVEVSCFKLKGEDYHFAHISERAQGSVGGCPVSVDYAIAGVLDGHGGKKAAEFSSKQVPLVFSSLLHERLPGILDKQDMQPYLKLSHVTEEQQRLWALQDAVVEAAPAAIRDTFIKVHADFLAKDVDSGTTATVVVLCGSQLITANVGDSLAYADLGTRVQQLTTSHRIDENTSEQRRIENSGGELGQAALDGKPVGPLRVWPGGLAFSRSLGDKHAGERVLAEPEVSQLLLGERGARIILASDGLWDVLTGKNAAHRVRTVACSKAAARLRSVAKDQRDRDDITVIVLDVLDDPTARIPAAIASAAGASEHQLWHPLTCSVHRWKDQWSTVMQARCPADSEMAQASDQEASASVDDSVSDQTATPALLYEEVRSITSAMYTHEEVAEQEWTAVPARHANSRSQSQQHPEENIQQDVSASLKSNADSSTWGSTSEADSEQKGARRNNGRGRGRGRGRAQGTLGNAGRGRGRGRGRSNIRSSDTAGASNSNAGVAVTESTEASWAPSGGHATSKGPGRGVPEKRRNAGRGRHVRRSRSNGQHVMSGHGNEGRSPENNISVQELFSH